MMGACDKGLQAAYHRNHTPVEKLHQPWVDDCMAQMRSALVAVEAMVDPAAPYLMLGRLTQADITAFVAERLARFGLNVDTATETPRLHAHRAQAGGGDRLPVDRALGDPREFGRRPLVVLCEHHTEGRDHAIEAAVRERQAFGVGELKRDGRAHMSGQFAGRLQQVGCDVRAHGSTAGAKRVI